MLSPYSLLVGAFSVITNLRLCFGWNFLKHYYRCSVASRTQQAQAEASMLVYSPVDEMEFVQRTLPGHLNVSCKVRS